MAGAIGRRAAKSQCSATRRRTPRALGAEHQHQVVDIGHGVDRRLGAGIQGDAPVAERRQLVERAGEIDHLDHRHRIERPGGRLGHRAALLGAAPLGHDHGAHGEGRGRTQDRAEIVRVVDLVEHQHHIAAGLGRAGLPQVESGQRRDRQGEALVHRACAEPARSIAARSTIATSTPGRCARGAETGQRLGGGEQAMAAAPRVGERRLDRMAAIQPQSLGRRSVGAARRVSADALIIGPARSRRLDRAGVRGAPATVPGWPRSLRWLWALARRLAHGPRSGATARCVAIDKGLAITILPPTFAIPARFGGVSGVWRGGRVVKGSRL